MDKIAVFKIILTPTPNMLRAGADMLCNSSGCTCDVSQIYQAMIDAALEEVRAARIEIRQMPDADPR